LLEGLLGAVTQTGLVTVTAPILVPVWLIHRAARLVATTAWSGSPVESTKCSFS